MLRSTKLLPLCKGARNWLVAGTVYGPKAATDASSGDDTRREESSARESRGYHAKRIGQEDKNVRPAKPSDRELHSQPLERSASPKSSFSARDVRDATFRDKVLRPHEHGRGYPELGPRDGLASVGRYAAYKSADNNQVAAVSSVKKSTSSSSFKSGSECSSTTADQTGSYVSKVNAVEQEDARSVSSETGSCSGLQFSSDLSSEQPSSQSSSSPSDANIFGSVPSLGEFKCDFEKQPVEKPGLVFHGDSSKLGACGRPQKALSKFSVPEVQKDIKNPEPATREAVSDNSSSTITELQREVKGKQEVLLSQSLQQSDANDTASVLTTASVTVSSQQQQQQHKKPGGQRHHRNRSSNSNNDSHKLVARVCSILNQHGWGEDAVRALDGLHINLNAYQVNEILKQQKEAGLAYNFFMWARKQAGFRHDVHTYTTMLGILGRARSFETLNKLLGEMIRDGCEPNVVTYNRLIHCYGRANDLESSLKLFNVMQMVGCEPDRVTYCTLIDLQAKAGFHDSAMELYKQMQQAGFRPDTFTYSIIIHCLGKAGKLNAAYKLFCEMTDRGYAPSLVTYNIIIDLHAKAGKFDMALKLYHDLQEVGYMPDRVTYGIIMEVLGNCGHIEDAEHVFEEMERAGWVADNPIFGLMVDMWGKTGNAEKAAQWFNRMLDSGLQPNVPACNSLLSAYLRACFYDAAGQVLRSMSKWGLLPTLQTYTSLLSSCAASRAQWEYDLVFGLMGCTGHPAHPFLCSLLNSYHHHPHLQPQQEIIASIRHFFDAMQYEELESRRGFADSLIDFLHKAGKSYAAGNVWEVAAEKNLYPYAVKEKAPHYWSINLHVMSMGTALVVLSKTLACFRETMLRTGAAPHRIDIITGWGRRSRITGSSLVKQAVEDMLRALNSPFHLDASNVGCFVGQGPALGDWLKRPQMEQFLHFA